MGPRYLLAVALWLAAGFPAYSQISGGDPVAGTFGPVFDWPLVGLHAAVLIDGRVVSYGSDGSGAQGVTIFDIWDPACGSDPSCHMVLPNSTGTDWFCSGGFVLPDGEFEIVGGDLRFQGETNAGAAATRRLDPTAETVSPDASMAFYRWYPTTIALPNQTWIVLGGRGAADGSTLAPTPEIYDPVAHTFAQLTGATSDAAFGNLAWSAWWYPRATVLPYTGHLGVVTYDGLFFDLDPSGLGVITQLPGTITTGEVGFPSISFAPGKLLILRGYHEIDQIDFTQSPPAVEITGYTADKKAWSNLTQLADGRVLLSGGEDLDQTPSFQAAIWDPIANTWTPGPSAAVHRAYHSTDILLPDATVLDMGGGATPALPYSNLNAQIYYPPHLFNQDGSLAVRPLLWSVPAITSSQDQICGGTDSALSAITITRIGSATHSQNTDQRWFSLAFNQANGPNSWCASIPHESTIAIPGFYMVFAWNQAGVPSLARIMQVTP